MTHEIAIDNFVFLTKFLPMGIAIGVAIRNHVNNQAARKYKQLPRYSFPL